MAGLFSVSVSEARGFVAVPADVDALAVVMGCSSAGSGLSPFYLSGQAAVTGVGYGDAVDTLTQIIEQVTADGGSGKKVPAALYTTPVTTTGSYGTIDVTGVTGSSVVTAHSATHPYGTYEAYLRVVAGGTIGVTGITLVWSLDNGRSTSRVTALGTATTFTIPNSSTQFDFAAGTLVAGDVVKCRTFAPSPATGDIDSAFAALAVAPIDFGLIVCEFPCTASIATHISSGLSTLLATGKRVTALIRTRIPTFETPESDATWNTSISADYTAFTDSRIVKVATYGLITDAMTARQYKRSLFAQMAADVVRIPRASLPDVPADQKMANATLIDATGATVGHDEGPRGASTGLSNDSLGNTFWSTERLPDFARREDVYGTVPWTCFAADERIRNLPTRRLANAIERTAVSAGNSALGENLFFIPGSSPRLTPQSRAALQGVIFAALKKEFKGEIDNADDAALDTGLVQVNPAVTVTGGNLLNVSVTLAPIVSGFLLTLSIVLAVQE